jgi:hypothetical protein
MKRILSVAAMLLTASCTNDKAIKTPTDSVKAIHDTLYVPLYASTDTVAVQFLYEGPKKDTLKELGYALVTGFKVQKGNAFQWIEQPKVSRVLNAAKKPVEKVIHVF